MASDSEDLPSDFFDDFNEESFMDGLSVIDSWEVVEGNAKRGSRIDAKIVGSVKDLRELINESKDEEMKHSRRRFQKHDRSKYKWVKKQSPTTQGGRENDSHLDKYIQPGSRRDPKKTNEAIRKDKQVKVKEYLAKRLDSDLQPPGTELDDFFHESKLTDKNYEPATKSEKPHYIKEKLHRNSSFNYNRDRPRHSPYPSFRDSPKPRSRRSPHHFSPSRKYRRANSPHEYHYRGSPHRHRYSPPGQSHNHHQYSPRGSSPIEYSSSQHSPHRYNKRRESPCRYSPRRHSSPRSSSRTKHIRTDTLLSPHGKDSFLYPEGHDPNFTLNSSHGVRPTYTSQSHSELAGYPYPPGPAYTEYYTGPYEYNPQPIPPGVSIAPAPYVPPMVAPQPVPAPIMQPSSGNPMPGVAATVTQPISQNLVSPVAPPHSSITPYDALAKLVAEGKLSQQDYLKLAPNKGSSKSMESKTRSMVLNRCNAALGKLGQLLLPNSLVMNNTLLSPEPKSLLPKFISPLKRHATVEFHATKTVESTSLQNKQLVNSIIASLGLEKVATRSKKYPKNMKDASVQTSKSFCDVCEIRDATKFYEVGTSVDQDFFSSSVHTQVLEQDLVSSKAIFNPTGSIADGAPISIAHLTPAQLVSQLAARAKTLKTSEATSGRFARRNPSNYDYEGRSNHENRGGGHQFHNSFGDYRY